MDFTIQCDHMIEPRRLDIVVVHKVKKETMIIDVNEKRSRNTAC